MDVEQRARELLAQAFGCEPGELLPVEVRAVRAVLAYHAALTPPEGYVLVPAEPTKEMIEAALAGMQAYCAQEVWTDMLSARPEVKP
ncbi:MULTISPECIES: hypothetical protein [unclassified Stenotrophomonas maltophilia group]|uniref:hypothetical protein n=1 Tax=unclassified Stenotrophomonas maltophilia group TaxID=2961925 RepID=UPI003BF7A493